MTIRGLPFKNFRGSSPAKLKVRNDKIEETKKQKTERGDDGKMDGIEPNGNHHLGHDNNQEPRLHLHPHLLPDKNGAQTRRVNVPIGSQLIGTSQLEHTWQLGLFS